MLQTLENGKHFASRNKAGMKTRPDTRQSSRGRLAIMYKPLAI